MSELCLILFKTKFFKGKLSFDELLDKRACSYDVISNMVNRIISIGLLLYIAVTCPLFFGTALFIWICTVLFDRRLVILHMFTSFWACAYLWAMPAWKMSVEGRDKIRKGGIYVIVSNHQSQLDILVAFRLFFPFKWVSKAQVFKLPFIGWNMALNRYIKLKRGDKQSIQRMMAACEKALLEGSSIFFFPEGTRSPTGVIKTFKPGAFILAKKLQIPILPIAINGTKNALPKHSLNFQMGQSIKIEVLDEIPYDAFSQLSAEQTGAMVRDLITEHVDEHGLNASKQPG
jgi:1-acyl-sn-glycerol-3-phosphate acyltransferase